MQLITLGLNSHETRSNVFAPTRNLESWVLDTLSAGRTESGAPVNAQTSLEVPIILACLKILSESISILPFKTYADSDRGRVEAKSTHLWSLLHDSPNPEMVAADLIGVLITHAALWGNAYVQIQRDNANRPAALWPKAPWLTHIKRDGEGKIFYETNDTFDGTVKVLSSDDVIHVKGFTIDGWLGLPMFDLARNEIGLSLAAARWNARWFKNGSRPGGILKLPTAVKPEDKKRMRAEWEALQSENNSHRLAILDNGSEWLAMETNPGEANVNDTRQFSADQIAQIMRVPQWMLAGGDQKTARVSLEMMSAQWELYGLRPWTTRIEQSFAKRLLAPRSGLTLKFDTKELMKADTTSRTAYFVAGIQNGYLSANDVRAFEDLPTIDGGDTYYRPLNYMAVDEEPTQVDSGEDEGNAPTIQ